MAVLVVEVKEEGEGGKVQQQPKKKKGLELRFLSLSSFLRRYLLLLCGSGRRRRRIIRSVETGGAYEKNKNGLPSILSA